MKNYSAESMGSSRVSFGAISFGIGYCMYPIGQYPLNATELQLLSLGGSTAVSLLGCDVLNVVVENYTRILLLQKHGIIKLVNKHIIRFK